MAFEHAYALTGGIATGKSTVCSLLKSYGFSIIDADLIAKECLNASKDELKELFGQSIFDNGIINRSKLADIVFGSNVQREKLNNLIHPKVRQEIKKAALKEDEVGEPYIMDIPLFFESGEYECKMSVVVYAPKEIQLNRLMKRNDFSEDEAKQRVDSQMDIELKKKKADWVIDNSGNLEQLKKETNKFVEYIRGQYASN